MKWSLFFATICCYVFFNVSNVDAQTVTVVNGTVSVTYSVSQLVVSTGGRSGSLASAVNIILEGDWSAADFLTFKKAIKTHWTNYNDAYNSTLKSVDMSGITSLSGNFHPAGIGNAGVDGFAYLFNNCTAMNNLVMPSVIPDGPVSFFKTFNECQSIKSLDLSLFTNISAMNGAIRKCYSLTDLMLPTTDNLYSDPSGVSFNATFQNSTRLKTIDLSHFTNISDIGWLVRSCEALEEVIFPTSNAYTGNVTFFNAFYGCKNLKTITNIDVFKKVSNLANSFNGCSSLIELKLGVNPNSVDSLRTTFNDINPACYKWFVTTPEVTDIPQTWKNYYNTSSTKNFYGNFVLPLTVAAVSAPATLNAGTTYAFTLPAITQPYAARVGEPIWRLIYNPNSDSPVTTLIEATGTTQNILFDKVGYYTIDCGVVSPNGITYWSAPAQITVVGVAHGSYSLSIAAPSTSIIEVKDADGVNIALSNPIVKEVDGINFFQFTQGVPGATYTVFQDGILMETAIMSPVPTYTAATGSHSSAPSENTVVELGTNLTLTESTIFRNLLTTVYADATYKNTYSSFVNFEAITVEDGLLVEVDLTKCNNKFAYLSLPFDFDVTTGVRYQKDGVEIVAVPEVDFYLSLYNPANRAANGEGTKNWTYVESGIIKAGEGFLIAKETANFYKILALNPNSLDATDKNVAIQHNAAAKGRTDWDSNWNFIGNPFTYEYDYHPLGDEPKYLYRRNNGTWAGGYEIAYDAVTHAVVLDPYTPYFTQIWGDEKFLTLEAVNSAAAFVSARSKSERNAFGLDLYKSNSKVDKVAWIFTPESNNSIELSEDAPKASVGKNSIWSVHNGRNLVYNNLPFEGDRMSFEFKINADANSTDYKLKMRSSTTEHHDVYIREKSSNSWHDLSLSDYTLPASTSSATRTFEVSIVKNQVVTSTLTQESSNVIVYSNNGTIFVEGVSYNDVVNVLTTSGVKVAEYSNNTQHSLSNLALGSYLIRISTSNGVITKKITNVAK